MKKILAYLLMISLSSNITFANTFLNQNTVNIAAPVSGKLGNEYFICANGRYCSTEDVVKEYYEHLGYKVMRAEVTFWQGMFALAFYDEIFSENKNSYNDIPSDLFKDEFYTNRKKIIDTKYEYLKSSNISEYITKQLLMHRDTNTRLLTDAPIAKSSNCLEYFQTQIVQEFLTKISPYAFALITYRIAQNPNKNRAGVPDFIIWNDTELIFVEVKRDKEKIRPAQMEWLSFLQENNLKNLVVRVSPIKPYLH